MSTNVQRTHQQRARRLAEETGMPYTAALRQSAAPGAAPTPAAAKTAGEDGAHWRLLWGHHLTFADPAKEAEGQIPHHFAGLVLPPAPGSRAKPWRLRVLPTGRSEPITIDGRRWMPSPAPARLAKARFDYDKGRPLPAVLMTPNMLRQQLRAEPAKGQQPAGVLDGPHGAVTPVYYIRDAVPLPELKGKRATAWQRNRTCADCGKWRDRPWELLGDTGIRVCPDCRDDRALRLWQDAKRAFAARARDWAKDVLADSNAVLLAFTGDVNSYRAHVRLADTTGQLLFASDALREPERTWSDAADDYLPDVDAEDAWTREYRAFTAALEGRRILYISHSTYSDIRPESWWAGIVGDLRLEPPAAPAETDVLTRYAAGWAATPEGRSPHILASDLWRFDLDHQALRTQAWPFGSSGIDQLIAQAAAVLADMAHGTAPGLDQAPDEQETDQ
jgi:hypothetical protein